MVSGPTEIDPAAMVEALAPERVLAYGSGSGQGRDLDLLVRPRAEVALREGLRERGYRDLGPVLVRGADDGCDVVELTSSESWRLEAGELERLFAEASPRNGHMNLVDPAPPHALLILARRAIYERRPEAFIRASAARTVAADPGAFHRARQIAPRWSAARALAVVERAAGGGRAGRVARAVAAASRRRAEGGGLRGAFAEALRVAVPSRRRRGVLIALSGLDGSGKSTLAAILEDLAGSLGRDATVVWSSLSQHPRWLHRLADAVRRALLATKRRPGPDPVDSPDARKRRAKEIRRRSATITYAWSLLVTARLGLALARATWPRLARGEVVICDRYTVDSWAELRYRYGADRSYRIHLALLRALTPAPDLAYYLDVPPEVASERKSDFSAADNEVRAEIYRAIHAEVGARRIDGTAPRAEQVERIATELWREIGGGG